MKGKQKLILFVVLLIILLGGGYVLSAAKKDTSTGGKEGSIFTSIKDALSKSVSLECNFTDDQGNKVKSVIKNGALRADVEGKTSAESGSVIMTEETMYFWDRTKKEGVKMMLPKDTVAGKPTADSKEEPGEIKEIMADLEQYKESCKPAVVSDSQFSPPSDVTFIDLSKMFNFPTGTKQQQVQSNQDINPQQVEQFLQQFSGSQSTEE